MPPLRPEEIQAKKLLREYTALAPAYDQRWSTYLKASLELTVEKLTQLPAGSVLDVACGTGQLLEAMADRTNSSRLVGIDRVPAMLELARRRLRQRATFLECDAATLPFDDAEFQLVVCTNALHYFPDVDAALREIRRVISPRGNLVITDWCRDYFWMRVLNRVLPLTQHAHAHTFSTRELRQCLRRAGFATCSETKRKIDGFWGLMTVHATPTS